MAETLEQLKARIAELEGKLATKTTVGIKKSEKGAVSVYGLGRFPVTLYAGQWEKLISKTPDITKFIADHKAELSWKE